jgi:hypothetical protein
MRIKNQTFLVLATMFVTAPLHASTLARLSLDQLAWAADGVARLHCSSTVSQWENGSIWTLATVDVVESMKGNLPAQLIVRVPGGRMGHLTATVDGTPKFSPGDDAIVFLERSRAGGYSVTGWVEGTFRISRDPQTGHETVTQDSSAFAVFDVASHAFRVEGVRRMPLEQFRARVIAAIARRQEKSR